MMKKIPFLCLLLSQSIACFSQVVINEIHVKPTGGDTDQEFQSMYNSTPNFGSEFIEIYNTSSCDSVDISCWTIGGMDGGTNGGGFSFPSGTIIPPLGFMTLGGPNTPAITFNLNTAANSARLWRSNASRWHLPNGDGWVALYDASGTSVDAVYWTFSSNDPTKLNTDATFTTGALQRIGVCGGGGLATASTIPGIEYISQATVTGQSYERSTDGGNAWVIGTATPNTCNGICATSSSFELNATVIQPTCGNNDGSISFAPSPNDSYFYLWPFPSNFLVNSVNNLAPGTYDVTITNSAGCSVDTSIVLSDGCTNFCDPSGNWVLFANYDGGNLNIVVDQNIPNLKIGICTYEPVNVTFSGPFVGNVAQVLYAGFNSAQNNNNCGFPITTSTFNGINPALVTVNVSPPVTIISPPNPNYFDLPNGWNNGIICLYSCDITTNQGGCNTADQVLAYFQSQFGGSLRGLNVQYNCWNASTQYTISGQTGNCCDICTTVTSTVSETICPSQLPYTWNGLTFTGPGSQTDTLTTLAGCDSLVTLNLTLANAVSSTNSQVACESFTWLDGTTYTTPGFYNLQYTMVGGSINGCDSIINLNLTLTDDVTGTDVQIACENYTWIDGITYTSSTNTPTFTIAGGSALGCDSIVTLDLTINPNYTTVVDVEACGFYIADNGQTYSESTTLSYEVAAQNGCDSVITMNLTVYPNPNAAFNSIPAVIEEGDSQISFNDFSTGQIESWSWTISYPNEALSSSEQNPVFQIPPGTSGEIPVSLSVTDMNGCTDSVTKTLTILQNANVFIPNCFTPDEDEINTTFQPVYSGAISDEDYLLRVYNRWGELIFQSRNKDLGWDGMNDGKPHPIGVYVYCVEYKLKSNNFIHVHYGRVTLLK
jgi:gliding motility-associated-like protein